MIDRRAIMVGAAAVALAAPAVARSSARRDSAVAKVETWAARHAIPGLALCIVENGEPVVSRGLGVRSLETGDALTSTTLVRVGSIAKAFSVLPALRLVRDGKLDLDAPIARYAPEFRVDPAITLRQAYSHSAGLVDVVTQRPDRGDDSIRAYVADMRPDWRRLVPGQHFSYSNPGYAAASLAVEKAGGEPFVPLAEAVLRELGLDQTTFDLGRVLVRPHSVGHESRDGKAAPLGFDPAQVARHDTAPGMLWMSAEDAGRWMTWLLTGPQRSGPISAEGYRQLLSPVIGTPALQSRYALGLQVQGLGGRNVVGHGGGIWGHSAYYEVAPNAGAGVAIFAVTHAAPPATELVEEIMFDLYGVPRFGARPGGRAGEEYVGRYDPPGIDGPPAVEIRRDGDVLVASGGPWRDRRLPPFGPDVFGTGVQDLIAFERDGSGSVIGVNLRGRLHARAG